LEVEADGWLVALRQDLMLTGRSGGELHGMASPKLCLLLQMMASRSSCVFLLSFGCLVLDVCKLFFSIL
jgi:hypothetical protein